jgi:acyl-CoA dehydrogenase
MKRRIFSEEHNIFRDAFRKFLEKEVVPKHPQWEIDGIVPLEMWRKAGEQGFLCPWLPEEYGGSGADFLYSVIEIEENARMRNHGFMMNLHGDVVVPYIAAFGSKEQKAKWLPGCVTGEIVTAVAMTEPGAGSDLASISATAVRDGDFYVVNGQKTFISCALTCNLVVVAVKTNTKAVPAHTGISLIVVEAGTPGFSRGKKLEKMGLHAQDTGELYFEDCRVPKENLLGPEGMGFVCMMQKLQQERLVCAIAAQAAAEEVLKDAIQYTKERVLFGKPLSKFQHTKFELAEMATEIDMGRVFVDRLISEHIAGENVIKETCMAKWSSTEMLKRVCDRCLQLYGGYGYMTEYNICKDYVNARVQTIYAGTTEIMKEIIGRQMGL